MNRLYYIFLLGLLVLSAATGYSAPQPATAQSSTTCKVGYRYDSSSGTCQNSTNGNIYNPSNDPLGMCPWSGRNTQDAACVKNYYPNGTTPGPTTQPGTVGPTTQPNTGNSPCISGYTYNSSSGLCTSAGSSYDPVAQPNGPVAPTTTQQTPNNGNNSTGNQIPSQNGQDSTGGTAPSQNGQDSCNPQDTACQHAQIQSACDAKKNQGYVFIKAFGNDPTTGYGYCVTLIDFFQTLINYFLMFSSIIAGIMFARGAYGILTSRGTPQAVADARETLTNAVIGLVLIALAFVVVKFLNGAFSTIDGSINLLGPFMQ